MIEIFFFFFHFFYVLFFWETSPEGEKNPQSTGKCVGK